MENQHELNVGVTPETANVDTLLRISPSATDLLETAFFIRGKGYNVLPIYGKKPIIDKWEHLKNSHQSLEEIQGYNWEKSTGLAIVFGVNNIHSLDIDDVKDESVLTDLMGSLGLPADYEWVERTGGGFQIFFLNTQDENPIEDRSYVSGDCVDERCDHFELRWKNCYSVVPPSRHFDKITNAPDGKIYSWMRGEPRGHPMEIPVNVLTDTWRRFTKTKDAPSAKPVEPSVPVSNSPEIEEAIQKFDMRRFLLAQRIPFREENDAQHQLRIEYEKGHNSLLWNDDKRCSNWMRESKGGGLFETLSFLVYGDYDFSKLDGPDKHNVFEILSQFSGVHIPPPEKNAPEKKRHLGTGEIVWTSGDQLFIEPDEVIEWLVEGVLELESFNSIYGPPGHGKSFVALELALKVLSGKDVTWLGRPVKKKGDVVYIRYEGGRKRFKQRFKHLCNSIGLTAEEMKRFHAIEQPPTLEVLSEELKRVCELWKPVLIVVDSLYMSHNKEENSNTDMKDLGKQLQDLMTSFGTCVLVIHHCSKHVEDQPLHQDNFRGAAMGALVEALLELRQDQQTPSERFWKWTKLRNGEDEDKKCEGGYFDPDTFFTLSTGETNEYSHLKGAKMKDVPKFTQYLQGTTGLPKSALVKMVTDSEHISQTAVYKRIDKAVKSGVLKENPTTKTLSLVETKVAVG